MKNEQPITISVTNMDGDAMKMTLPWDVDLAGMADCFRSILFWLTFSPESIDDYVPDYNREWYYADEKEKEVEL